MSGNMSNLVKIIWRYIEDGVEATYLDEGEKNILFHDYIESLFDQEHISYDERKFLLERPNLTLAEVANSTGIVSVDFPCYVKSTANNRIPNTISKTEAVVESIPIIQMPQPIKQYSAAPPSTKFQRYVIQFTCNENRKLWNCAIKSEHSPIRLNVAENSQKNDTEVVFLVDGTQSMAKEISTIRRTVGQFAESIASTGSKVRFGLVAYGIAGENFTWKKKMPPRVNKVYRTPTPLNSAYCTVSWPLASAERFKDIVENEMRIGIAGRKGCYFPGAGSIDVLYDTMKLYSTLDDSVNRFIIHISDEFDKTRANSDKNQVIEVCNSNGIVMHIWGCPIPAHRVVAEKTGGNWWPIDKKLGQDEFDEILHSISNTIAEAISLKSSPFSVDMSDSGPRCEQYNSSPVSSGEENSGSRGVQNALNENEGFVAIDNFTCMYCEIQTYFVCQECGHHNCRSGERSSFESQYVAETNCGKCGTLVHIREESEVQSSASKSQGKKG